MTSIRGRTLHRWVAFGGLALVLALGGCVSYEERVFTKEASPEETLELRVELARKYIGQGDWEKCAPPESDPGYGPTVHRLTVARIELYDILVIT